MSHSISFYLRRENKIYVTLTVNGLKTSRSTGISVPNPKCWDGRYYRDPRSKSESGFINDRVQKLYDDLDAICTRYSREPSFTSDVAFRRLDSGASEGDKDKPFTLVKACEFYIQTYNDLKKWSDLTRSNYENIIKLVVKKWIRYQFDMDDISLAELKSASAKEFGTFLNKEGFSPNSQTVYINFVAAAITNVLEDYPIDEYPEIGMYQNPFLNKKIKPKKEVNKLEDYYSPESESTLWEFYESLKDEFTKDYTFLCLWMWNTGMSYMDLGASEYSISKDINLGDVFTYQRHKSSVEGRIVIHPGLRQCLDILAKNRNRYKARFDNWLPVPVYFPKGVFNRRNYKHTHRRLYVFIKEVISPVLGKEGSPHAFRHSFAVKMLQMGYSMDAVKTFMAHSTGSTTETFYGFVTNKKLLTEQNRIQGTGTHGK